MRIDCICLGKALLWCKSCNKRPTTEQIAKNTRSHGHRPWFTDLFLAFSCHARLSCSVTHDSQRLKGRLDCGWKKTEIHLTQITERLIERFRENNCAKKSKLNTTKKLSSNGSDPQILNHNFKHFTICKLFVHLEN